MALHFLYSGELAQNVLDLKMSNLSALYYFDRHQACFGHRVLRLAKDPSGTLLQTAHIAPQIVRVMKSAFRLPKCYL